MATAQGKFFTRTGSIRFYSETPVENIEAVNTQTSSIFDTDNGDIVLSAQMIGFEFEKALMQEHFNENYVESEKFPKSTFKGKIIDYDQSIFSTDAKTEVNVEGELMIHGVTKNMRTVVTVQKTGDKIQANAEFHVKVADYDIKIPNAVVNNISESVLVTVDLNLEPYNK
jgi:polyisoprenoid-binding protein YceI